MYVKRGTNNFLICRMKLMNWEKLQQEWKAEMVFWRANRTLWEKTISMSYVQTNLPERHFLIDHTAHSIFERLRPWPSRKVVWVTPPAKLLNCQWDQCPVPLTFMPQQSLRVMVMLASHQEEGQVSSEFNKPVIYMGISEIHDSKDF